MHPIRVLELNEIRPSVHRFGVIGGEGLGFGDGDGGDGEDVHLQVWFRGGSGMFTLHSTPSTPSQVNIPLQPIAHISPEPHPNVFPSTHSAFDDNCLVQAQLDAAADTGAESWGAGGGSMVERSPSLAVLLLFATAVQFMIGVVNINGDARIAHIENSVIDSSRVTFGGPSVGS